MDKPLFFRLKKATRQNVLSGEERASRAKKLAQQKANVPMLKAINSARAIQKQNAPKIVFDDDMKKAATTKAREVHAAVGALRDAEASPVMRPSPRISNVVDNERRYSTQHDDTAKALGMPTQGERQTRQQLHQAKTAARETEMKNSNYPRPRGAPPPTAEPEADKSGILSMAKTFIRTKYKPRTA